MGWAASLLCSVLPLGFPSLLGPGTDCCSGNPSGTRQRACETEPFSLQASSCPAPTLGYTEL